MQESCPAEKTGIPVFPVGRPFFLTRKSYRNRNFASVSKDISHFSGRRRASVRTEKIGYGILRIS